MKTTCFTIAAGVILSASMAHGDVVTASYGWEDGGLSLGGWNNDNIALASETDSAYVYEGNRSLRMTEDPTGGTPQTFVAWITGLTVGDIVRASFMAWDDSAGESPSVRIWGSWSTNDDITNYTGSAGGSNTYSSGTPEDPWSELSHEFDTSGNDADEQALVIQCRFYASSSGTPELNTLWIDDLNIEVEGADLSGVVIHTPVPAPGALALLGLGGLAAARRRRA